MRTYLYLQLSRRLKWIIVQIQTAMSATSCLHNVFSIIYLDIESSVAEEISFLYICAVLSYLESLSSAGVLKSCYSIKLQHYIIKLTKFCFLYTVHIGPTQYTWPKMTS